MCNSCQNSQRTTVYCSQNKEAYVKRQDGG